MTNGRTTIATPFTFDGGFFLSGTGLLRELTGSGTATLALRPFGAADFPPSWFIESVTYDFADSAPVPEPSTLALTATALACGCLARAGASKPRGCKPFADRVPRSCASPGDHLPDLLCASPQSTAERHHRPGRLTFQIARHPSG